MSGAGLSEAGLFPAGLGGLLAPTAEDPFVPGDPPAVAQGDELAPQTGHVAQAIGLLIEQFKKKQRIQELLRPWLSEVQAAEDAAFGLLTEQWLDTASGRQLDNLGRIIDEPRLGRDDETYRVFLRVRIAVNRSNGTTSDLLNIVRLAVGPGIALRIDEQFPAAFVLEIIDPIDENLGSLVAQIVCEASAAGVRCLVHWRRSAARFRYSQTGTAVPASPNGYGNGEYSAISDGSAVHTFVP